MAVLGGRAFSYGRGTPVGFGLRVWGLGVVVYRILEAARPLVEHPAAPRVALCERLGEG